MQIHEWITPAIVIAVGAFIYNFLRNFKTDIKQDFKEMKSDISAIRTELKAVGERTARIEGFMQGKESERLFYEIRKTGTEEKK